MIRIKNIETHLNECWPRTSGDDPYSAPDISNNVVLAPHERG